MSKPPNLTISKGIQYIGLFIMWAIIGIGMLYWTKGSFTYPIPGASVLVFALWGTVYVLKKLQSEEKNQRRNRMIEILVLILGYGGLSALTILFFSHIMDLTISKKEELRNSGKQKMENISTLFDEYQKHVTSVSNKYKVDIENNNDRNRRNTERIQFLDDNNIEESQLNESKKLQKKFRMKLFQGYKSMKKEMESFVDGGNAAFQGNFTPIRTYNDADLKYDNWKTELITMSNALPYGAKQTFKPTEVNSETIDMSALSFNKIKNLQTLISFLFVNIMILWPYLFGERSRIARVDGKSGSRTGGEL
jgi:hypothetical protein